MKNFSRRQRGAMCFDQRERIQPAAKCNASQDSKVKLDTARTGSPAFFSSPPKALIGITFGQLLPTLNCSKEGCHGSGVRIDLSELALPRAAHPRSLIDPRLHDRNLYRTG